MIIGYLKNEYPERRCIIGMVDGVGYVSMPKKEITGIAKFTKRCVNYAKRKLRIPQKGMWDQSAEVNQSQLILPKIKPDIVHTFNTVYNGSIPWCCTFESQTPVTDDLIGRPWEHIASEKAEISAISKRLLELCADDKCLGLIAISKSAYDIEIEMLNRIQIDERLKNRIISKVCCVHPPQNALISDNEMNEKWFPPPKKTELVFCGHDFFLKGGLQVLRALSVLADTCDFHLSIISQMRYGDYASLSTGEDYNEAMAIIRSSGWVDQYDSLPNEKVIEIMKKAHIGLLPSLADTYGYSVLEMQACGCACVTTNIRALGEINSNECGWVCDVEPNKFGEAIYGNDPPEKRNHLFTLLEEQLKDVFSKCFAEPEIVKEKAIRSLERIKKKHSKSIVSDKIANVYQERGE